MKQRTWAGALAAVMTAGMLVVTAPRPAQARSEDAWRVGTYLGGAATAAGIARGDATMAILGAGAGLLSYSQWQKEMHHRHRREHTWREYSAYRSNWYYHHRHRHHHHR